MKIKTTFLLVLALFTLVFTFVGFGCKSGDSVVTEGEPYEFTFNKPFAGTPDAYMKIDGILDEDVWKNKAYLEHSVKGKAWAATTHFTEKGVYIAVKVTDPKMVYRLRFSNRSAFFVYLCKTGEQTYGLNSLAYHEGRCFQFQLDPYYCRSLGRVPYNYKAHVEGELNGDTECTMTAELFLTWKDLYYTEEELGENGYPEAIQMYVNYNGEATEVLGSCLWREDVYFSFGKEGYKGRTDDENLGDVKNGVASTDRWKKNESGNLYTTAGRTQIVWLKEAYAKDFMFETTLKPLSKNLDGTDIKFRGDKVYGRFGLITENSNADYSVYSSSTSSAPAVLQLQTCRQIDSLHWQNKIGVRGGNMSSGITDEFVTFRIIKQGDMFYYFYGDTYWKSERIQDLQDKVYCGIFTSQGVEILDYNYENFEGKEDDLKAELSKYMYFVSVPGASTYGNVSGSAYSVAKGESVTVSFVPNSRGVLTGITLNGEDKYDEITAEMNDECEYTFTPAEDVTFTATFSAFNSADLVRTVVAYKDNEGNLIKNGSYHIFGSEKTLFYKGTPNDSGYVIVYIPKAGTYEVGGRTFDVSGDYRLVTTFSDYNISRSGFTINDETTSTDINGKAESVAKNKSFTKIVTVVENAWGETTVNGTKLTGSGTLLYNEETGNYYVENQGLIRYYKNYVAKDYELLVKMNLSDVGNANGDLAGIAITNGKYIIVLKVNLSNAGALIVATGSGATDSVGGRELAVNGFGWGGTITDPHGGANGGGTFSFKVVKKNNVIYLYNQASKLVVYFDKTGMHLAEGATIRWGSAKLAEVNADIQKILAEDTETAIGVRTHCSMALRAEYTLIFSTKGGGILWNGTGWGDWAPSRPDTATD